MFPSAKLIYKPDARRVPVFRKVFTATDNLDEATLRVSALGTFQVFLNGEKIGDDVLSPGWTSYKHRIGAVTYTIEDGLVLLPGENLLEIIVTHGWYSGRISLGKNAPTMPQAVIAELKMGNRRVVTNTTWEAADSCILSSDIYDGIVCDARLKEEFGKVAVLDHFDKSLFYPIYENGEGTPVSERETIFPSEKIIVTPRGERVLDFGQNIVGYPVLSLNTPKGGGRVKLSFAEVLDRDGNFYTDNYRGAVCAYDYTARRGRQFFSPIGTFYGFRYVRIDAFAGEYAHGAITARIICSDMARTGDIKTGHPLINRLFDNVIRGQLGNYVDIPTDCPQRDERLGWTGDAEVFIKAAAYNFNVLAFFRKWLGDCVLEQTKQGYLPHFIPTPAVRFPDAPDKKPAAAWSDFITIIPYELYLMYGDRSILKATFPAMKKYVDCIPTITATTDLWTGKDPDDPTADGRCEGQYGDWLGLDAEIGSYYGASDMNICMSAYYLHSLDLLCRVGKILGKDMSEDRARFLRSREKYIKTFESRLKTQTELLLTLAFGLTDRVGEIGKRLIEAIRQAGDQLQTGFMGTGHILHVLSDLGEHKLAYDLLLRTEYPSWLYPVTKGATTIWEHWDGIRPDGTFWSKDMNSFNHYAYGSVADWLYAVAGGIRPDPEAPGFARAIIAPCPDPRLGNMEVRFETIYGRILSSWYYEDGIPHYRIETPVPAKIVIDGTVYEVEYGKYVF